MSTVEVFKTNVQQAEDVSRLLPGLTAHLPGCRITFDLEDCDKVLRVEGSIIVPDRVIGLVQSMHYQCALLD